MLSRDFTLYTGHNNSLPRWTSNIFFFPNLKLAATVGAKSLHSIICRYNRGMPLQCGTLCIADLCLTFTMERKKKTQIEKSRCGRPKKKLFLLIHSFFWCGQRFSLVLAWSCKPPVTSVKEISHSSVWSPQKPFF